MKLHKLEGMSGAQRRRLLKWMGAALVGPAIPLGVRHAVGEMVLGKAYAAGPEALAAAAAPSNFIEINLRDQMDWGHVFVAPGLATNTEIRRGTSGNMAALFFTQEELKAFPNNVYLTGDSAALEPHLDTVAFVDTCEITRGNTHGHEAANPTRAPGKLAESREGYLAMFERDGQMPGEGNERSYSSVPTPASLHNYVQKLVTPNIRNGATLKFLGRGKHTVYHFAAGLAGGELDRIRTREELATAFPNGTQSVADYNVLASAADAEAAREIMSKLDLGFLKQRQYADTAISSHEATLSGAQKLLYGNAPQPVNLSLTEEEIAYWSEGVPKQVASQPKMEIWEQIAIAFKLIQSGITRSVGLEFCFEDVHDRRDEMMMRTYAKQTAIPLARLIAKLKESIIYDSTAIAIYTLDGGRPPDAGYSGDRGKNSVILAGGKVKGGYFGDVRLKTPDPTRQLFSYHAPDPVTGIPGPGVTDNSARLPSKNIWRTVMKAAGIPDALCDTFPDVAGAAALPYMLRA